MLTRNLALLLLWPGLGLAAEVPPLIDADATWTAADSPYLVREDVAVAEGVQLVIEPGTRVELVRDASILIHGALLARGTESEPVVFTGLVEDGQPARWRSVVLEASSPPATFERLDDYVDGSIIEHVVFEHAHRALELRGASPYIVDSHFRHNEFRYTGALPCGAAIFMTGGSAPRIRDTRFTDNIGQALCQGGAIYVEASEPIIQDSVFIGNSSSYGAAVATDNMSSPLVGNRFERNTTIGKGGAAAFVSSSPAFLNNHVEANESALDGAGVHVCVECFPHSTPFFMDNVITGNITSREGAAGFGSAHIRVFAYNDVYGNTKAGEPSDFGWFNAEPEAYPAWDYNPKAPHNYWGTTDTAAVSRSIFDGHDDPAYGKVDFEPLSAEPIAAPRTRITITTRKLRYGTVEEPMPVYLTLYNPGEERALDLVVLLQYGEGPALPFHGPIDLPGARDVGGKWRLTMPENSVWFGTPLVATWRESEAPESGYWHAALFDSESGERVGEVSTIRFVFGPEVE